MYLLCMPVPIRGSAQAEQPSHLFCLSVFEMQKICLAWGLLLVASHKADFGWPLLPWHVINAAHGGWTERTSVFIRGI